MAIFELIEPGAGATLWRADLPADPAAARAALDAEAATLREQERALDSATDRLKRVSLGGDSFSTSVGAPEQELLAVLGDMQGGDAASFGLRESAGAAWAEAEAKFQAFAQRARNTLSGQTLVETRVEGRLIARTSVSLTGQMSTLMRPDPTPEQVELHRSTLALALRSRVALLRTFATVARGAAIVATMFSSPAGAVMALPAAWKFVDQLLDDIRGNQTARTP